MDQLTNIAVIDDDVNMALATGNLVQALGYEVDVYHSAEEFLASPDARQIWCLITDVQMPTMNGLELQAYMNANGYSASIIFVTGFPNPVLEANAIKAGALCYLTKPFDTTMLSRYIEIAKANVS